MMSQAKRRAVVLLSGGLDSSLLVALLAEIGVRDFHTFSVGFEDQPEEKGSEFEYSDQVVERYRPIHHKFLVPNEQVLKRLPEAVDAMAEPMFGQDAVAFYLLSEQVSKHIKVVQSGQGADEVFGGYFWYPRMLADTEGSRLDRFRRHYFDRDHPEYLRLAEDNLTLDCMPSWAEKVCEEWRHLLDRIEEFVKAISQFQSVDKGLESLGHWWVSWPRPGERWLARVAR